MKRILTLLLVSFSLILSLSVGCLAAEPETILDNEETTASSALEDAEKLDTGTEMNIFQSLYSTAMENKGEILSLLSLIGSLIVAFAYKRGLIPTLSGSLGSISGEVKRFSEGASESIKEGAGLLGEAAEMLTSLEERLERLSDSLSDLEGKLASATKSEMTGEAVLQVLLEEVNLLSDVFLSSSLPEYRKELVGERIALMKKTIEKRGAENEEEH